MKSILELIIFRIENIFNVLTRDFEQLQHMNILVVVFNAILIFGFFFFISRFFRAYILRLALFLSGFYVLWQVLARDTILFSFDFYGSLGLIAPQLEIPYITYLIIKYRTIYIYDKLKELILLLFSPFFWLYEVLVKLTHFYKAKKEFKEYQNSFKNSNEEFYKQEYKSNKNKENKKQKRESNNKEYNYKKSENKQEKLNSKKDNPKSRWESNNAYEILGVSTNATKAEIKKAYRNLSKIYHPDLTINKKEEYTKIFQKINWAYNILK